MKKKVAIITMIDNENCGNRLQNYALQELLKKFDYDVTTIRNDKFLNTKNNIIKNLYRFLKKYIKDNRKNSKFKIFNKNIKFSSEFITIFNCKKIDKKYDYFVVGSDQIWKPTRMRMSYIDLLGFASPNKRIAYAPSFGLYEIEEKYYSILKSELPKFKAISVREDAGKKIINEATEIKNVEVVLDPTMMISKDRWETLEMKPSVLEKKKFIFTYFLGDEDVEKIKQKFNSNIYQFVDFYKNDFGPQEFIYLIHHAEVILTDSFHACAFSLIFNKNFYIFDRKQTVNNNNMNSRIDTLSRLFQLENRRIYDFDEIKLDSKIDYKKINYSLKENQKKSIVFLENAFKED